MKRFLMLLPALLLLAGCSGPPAPPAAPGSKEAGKGVERAQVKRSAEDSIRLQLASATGTHAKSWDVVWTVRKWSDSADYRAGRAPDRVEKRKGNILLTAGITRMLNLLGGAGGTAYNATNTRIGVGNGTTSVSASDTDLSAASGSSNRQFKLVSGAPSISGNQISWTASFGDSIANFAWNEFGIDNGTSDGTTVTAPLLNRKVPSPSLGTKSGGTWTLTVTITIS